MVDVYVFGIDQNLAGPKRQYGGIDMHRIGTAALDLMNPITVPNMATEPLNTRRIGDVAAGHEQVAPAAKEIGGVEDWFEFGQDIGDRLAFFGDAKLCIEQLVRQLRPGRGGPARAASEIVLQDRTIGVRLEVATRPSHGRFDDLVADHEHAVARTGIAEPARRPYRRAEALLVLDGFWPPYHDAQRLQQRNKAIKIALRRFDHTLRIAEACAHGLRSLRH